MDNALQLNDLGYFETRGLNILVFSNWYDSNFDDAKISGVELIHHGVRTATNGDMRLSATPSQWDAIPQFIDRKVDAELNAIEASLAYPEHDIQYTIKAVSGNKGITLSLHLEKPLPKELEGQAGFNIEFLPSAYFGKAYLVDGQSGIFPRYPSGPMADKGKPGPLARGTHIVLAPEDPTRRVAIQVLDGELLLFDGRNIAQNGWYVLCSPIPAGKSGKVVEWLLSAGVLPGWMRRPVIAHSQVGYHPDQEKVAVIELDKNDQPLATARLLKVIENGELVGQHTGGLSSRGSYLRYNYFSFDFSRVREAGLYVIAYGDVRTRPFRIAHDVYETVWHPTLDVFLPAQMDHMLVREAYRVWHGASHLDDALQAPVDHEHFDLYAQGPTTDTPYQPGEHVPGLNIGGWYDAGDFDIRTQTQYHTVLELVHAWESFDIKRDQTTVDQDRRYVEIHAPDGIPDMLQQIEHGTLALIAQFRAVGHAIHGIIAPDLQQYTHLGDGASKTDNLIYNPELAEGESDGFNSGTPDDRWAFTSRATALNYGSIAALAAAGRALRGYRDDLAEECLETALQVWDEEHQHEPDIFRHGNTTGGPLLAEELRAATELLITTQDARYAERIEELWPDIEEHFQWNAITAARALPYMSESYTQKLEARVRTYRDELDRLEEENPFGVPIFTGGWAGNGHVMYFAITNYLLHKAFPEIIDAEFVFRGLNYLFGCHPDSDISFVSGVGTASKEIAYGTNRADFSFIAGGIVPGVLILKPDFPENKEDWPFLWGENEYVVNMGAGYIFLVNAVRNLLENTG
ncbi:MAG: glycoside hydrolase family 9 protein [Anaerolineae bacterium]|nr:glycoside hydrolase family 9 protein [Anaerolineae bacterium]